MVKTLSIWISDARLSPLRWNLRTVLITPQRRLVVRACGLIAVSFALSMLAAVIGGP